MAEPIKFTDLIKPDDTINELIQQLRDAKDAYEKLAKSVKTESGDIAKALHSTSGATEEGKQKILELAAASDRLASAEKAVAAAIEGLSRSEKGIAAAQKEVVAATANTVDNMEELRKELEKAKREAAENTKRLEENARAQRESAEATERHARARKEEAEEIEYAADSYKALKKELKELDKLFKTLSQVDRIDPELGGELAKEIVDLKKALKDADAALTPFVSGLYELAKAKNKLAFARSEENRELKLYTSQIREANRVAELEVAITNSAEGSYNRLSAQYALNKIRLNQMGEADEEAVRAKRALELETKALYQQMIKLQEATGNHTLSVGNYKKVWNGLGMSVNQIVRELPAAAISLNTFFLGISNNVPILMDEIRKVRDLNAKLRAEGKQTKSVIGEVTRALFSWNTVMVLLLTVFAMHGEAIINWIANLFRGEAKVLSLTSRLKALNEELKDSSKSYGANYVAFKKLADEWKALTSEKEKLQWIEDNRSEFNRLRLAINDVNDADTAFITSTSKVLAAMKLRARATAAESLAAEKYAEELTKREEARQARLKVEELQKAGGTLPSAVGSSVTGYVQMGGPGMTEVGLTEKAAALDKVAEAAKATADAYYDMAAADNAAADAALKSLGLFGKSEKANGFGGRTPRDAEDTLESLSLSATKAYQDSITKLERDEIKKRRKEYLEAYNTEVADLARKYNKIQRILDGQDSRYKKLTKEQKEQALKAQDDIVKAIENKKEAFSQNWALLTYQKQEQDARTQLDTLNLQIDAVKAGSEEELRLRLQILRVEEQIALARNKQLPPAQQQDESTIKAGFKKQRTGVITDFNDTAFDQQQALEKAKFEAVKHNEQQITQFTLQQEKERWERKIRLAKSGALDWSEAQVEAAEKIVEDLDTQIKDNDSFIARVGKRRLSGALFESFGWNEDQIDAMQQAANIVVDQFGAILDAEVSLAEKEKELADERVQRAQDSYKAEIDARNAGLAANIEGARKELDLARRQQQEKQRMLEQAQRRQAALDTVMQTSSLITASANLWSSFSKLGPFGPALAIAAIATMWGSFVAAKIKARQVTATQEYGEGGFEVLEGGSHASGHDIDLGTTNKKGKRMKAEGGEALAIINKRNTRKYKKVLPDIVESLNKGIFEEKYATAFSAGEAVIIAQEQQNSKVNLSVIEETLGDIKKQGDTRYYYGNNGEVIEVRGNVKRIIRN